MIYWRIIESRKTFARINVRSSHAILFRHYFILLYLVRLQNIITCEVILMRADFLNTLSGLQWSLKQKKKSRLSTLRLWHSKITHPNKRVAFHRLRLRHELFGRIWGWMGREDIENGVYKLLQNGYRTWLRRWLCCFSQYWVDETRISITYKKVSSMSFLCSRWFVINRFPWRMYRFCRLGRSIRVDRTLKLW